MSTDHLLSGPTLPAASGTSKSVVILLHGYGADGNDLIGLAPHLARALPDTSFYSPNAPFPCEMSPFGRQWFSLAEYDPEFLRRAPETMSGALAAMAEGANKSASYVNDFIDHVMETHGIDEDRIALVGFSQGTMMSLQTAPRRAKQLAGVVGFSGALLGDGAFATDLKSRPPVLLVHGTADPVVPIEASRIARDTLAANGIDVSLHERPNLQHGIDEEGLGLALEFLRKHLG
ncbi:alpha/beta hydrolase [Thalassospira povalilytica]|uniref:Alpha/beta fold hydrolase n=1 Tax=Thalassospira povalilytica TaxID=732237 RepID=A0A8I1SI36_9PROT|nr:alpha/beta fold hydrolase [Thalassospira povalilytica]MBN8196912.1 alpha/beta fold hydrolase [Thalassospira povalilytica]PKR50867.1 phospholipase [Thalassospira povalilytica]RCK27316.1 phospholipase [Thalassospira profundimaris]